MNDYIHSEENIEGLKNDAFLLDAWLRAGNHPDFFLEWNGYTRQTIRKPIVAIRKEGRQVGAAFSVKSAFVKNNKIEYVQIRKGNLFTFARSVKEFIFKPGEMEDNEVWPAIHFRNKSHELFARHDEFYLDGILYNIKKRAMLLEFFDYESKDEFLRTSLLDYISIPMQVPHQYAKDWQARRREKERLGLEFFNVK